MKGNYTDGFQNAEAKYKQSEGNLMASASGNLMSASAEKRDSTGALDAKLKAASGDVFMSPKPESNGLRKTWVGGGSAENVAKHGDANKLHDDVHLPKLQQQY